MHKHKGVSEDSKTETKRERRAWEDNSSSIFLYLYFQRTKPPDMKTKLLYYSKPLYLTIGSRAVGKLSILG